MSASREKLASRVKAKVVTSMSVQLGLNWRSLLSVEVAFKKVNKRLLLSIITCLFGNLKLMAKRGCVFKVIFFDRCRLLGHADPISAAGTPRSVINIGIVLLGGDGAVLASDGRLHAACAAQR